MSGYKYDCVVILGGGLYKIGETFYPTEYNHTDEFGMLGGGIRVDAALELYWQKKVINLLFSTGVSAKQVAKFGRSVPPEAKVYADDFNKKLKERIEAEGAQDSAVFDEPSIHLEVSSMNTASNLQEVIKIINSNGWKKTAIISSDYHVARIRALLGLMQREGFMVPDGIEVLSAENIMKKARPGVYDAKIETAYKSDAAQKRVKNEENGLKHITEGRYVLTEYQLARSSRKNTP